MAAATSLNKRQLIERAQKAALARTTTEYLIKKLIARAPELTDEQIATLRALPNSRGAGAR